MVANNLYEFGSYRLDPAERRLLRDGEPVALTPKSFDLLVLLVQNSDHLLKKEELLERLWPGQFVEEANLSFNISSLRKVLGQGEDGRSFIETVPKKGFRFVAHVKERPRDEVGAAVEHQGEAVPAENSEAEVKALEHAPRPEPATGARAMPEATTKVVKGDRPIRAWRLGLVALASLALAILVNPLFIREKSPSPNLSVASIAVLPLENLSDSPTEEYFADGMTDELIGDLAKIGGLRVISRTSSMHYKGTKKPLPEIARELKVDAVVEGTVQRSGERVRIRAQLIHAATDQHLWVETYERDLRDVLQLQRNRPGHRPPGADKTDACRTSSPDSSAVGSSPCS
jgi:TolB-like protein/DNA-binding winged helix-turn-helix (wHTH) protein